MVVEAVINQLHGGGRCSGSIVVSTYQLGVVRRTKCSGSGGGLSPAT